MSNLSITSRIRQSLAEFQAGSIDAAQTATILRVSGQALEAMPYDLIKEFESIASVLQVAHWTEEEGCAPDLSSVLERVELWLEKVPLDV